MHDIFICIPPRYALLLCVCTSVRLQSVGWEHNDGSFRSGELLYDIANMLACTLSTAPNGIVLPFGTGGRFGTSVIVIDDETGLFLSLFFENEMLSASNLGSFFGSRISSLCSVQCPQTNGSDYATPTATSFLCALLCACLLSTFACTSIICCVLLLLLSLLV